MTFPHGLRVSQVLSHFIFQCKLGYENIAFILNGDFSAFYNNVRN